jgi:hypothetical protein
MELSSVIGLELLARRPANSSPIPVRVESMVCPERPDSSDCLSLRRINSRNHRLWIMKVGFRRNWTAGTRQRARPAIGLHSDSNWKKLHSSSIIEPIHRSTSAICIHVPIRDMGFRIWRVPGVLVSGVHLAVGSLAFFQFELFSPHSNTEPRVRLSDGSHRRIPDSVGPTRLAREQL